METHQIANAAALLVKARRGGPLLADLPVDVRPANVTDAHAIQDAVTAGLGKPVGAFKAMAPANGDPTRGVIYGGTIHSSPCKLPASTVPQCGQSHLRSRDECESDRACCFAGDAATA